MSYKKQLKDVTDIITGMSFSSRDADPKGSIPVIQASFVDTNAVISDFTGMKKLSELPSRSPAIVQDNDIVLVSRATPGNPFKASLIKTATPLVASSSVYVIRALTDEIYPEYLLYILNSKIFQQKVLEKARGSTIAHITKRALLELEIPIPDKKTQQTIINFYQNIQKQIEIQKREAVLKSELIDATFNHLYSQ